MNPPAFPLARLFCPATFIAALMLPPAYWAAHGAIDPGLNVTVTRTNESVVLQWFGSNSVAYQVQSSSTLAAWTDSSLVLTGSGAFLTITRPISPGSNTFFRVSRLLPPENITASFDVTNGFLIIIGDDRDNTIAVSRDIAGTLRVNGGSIPITGGVPTVANTTLIQIFGRAGHDHLSLDEANGALPAAYLFGEAGNDTLIGGSSADTLNGGTGNDTLLGKGGADSLYGGDDDDTLTGGDGGDLAYGEAGNDTFIWNPGDDTDLNEGGPGVDTVQVNGGAGAETFTITANGTRVHLDRLDPAPFYLDIGTCENLVLNCNAGNDSVSCTGNLAALIQITVDGGPGDDTILGSNGIDLLIGGDDNDFIDGQQGNDVVFLGDGDDTFQWDPGDGSDTVEGQAGTDTLLFNGSNAAETFTASPNGSRLQFTRNVGTITMDVDDVEVLNLNALGGADTVTVNDLTATDLTSIHVDLASTLGGSGGDSLTDTIIVNGTSLPDTIHLMANAGAVEVSGLHTFVRILHPEASFDSLVVNGLGGADIINTGPGVTSLISVTANQ
ncbi:MAG TPA: calcium-binding protein [Verrucomicrobiota bacterium]|nr:calcium-binding protein [Verrucomicrobiota bacterium]